MDTMHRSRVSRRSGIGSRRSRASFARDRPMGRRGAGPAPVREEHGPRVCSGQEGGSQLRDARAEVEALCAELEAELRTLIS